MKKIKISFALLGIVFSASAQTSNNGKMSISPNTKVVTLFDFVNTVEGKVSNDGELHFRGHYENNGTFNYTDGLESGYVVFEGTMPEKQIIKGSQSSYFYNVLFNKEAVDENAFHLKGEIVNSGTVDFSNGVVLADNDNGGAFVFLKGAVHQTTSDTSHVRGEVEKEGDEDFKFPIGDSGQYRFASISAPSNLADLYVGEYLYENSNMSYPHTAKEKSINIIDDKEYWIINQADDKQRSVIVTLSWDEDTTPSDLYVNQLENLVVVRWDNKFLKWVNEGGVVDPSTKTVSTPLAVDGFGIYTLGTKLSTPVDGRDLVIYNGVTPNGDGNNDTFIIKNIDLYPNNTVKIYNRWGRDVFFTEKYGSNRNEFKGIAEGKGIVNAGEKLPTGTYYYVVEYLKSGDQSDNWTKKVGYLHLETE